jgi:TolA-binding protein
MQMLGKKDDACTAFVNLPKEFPSAAESLKVRAKKAADELNCNK